MKIRQGVQDLIFLDFDSMFDYLIDLEDHLLKTMKRYPEYDIKTLLMLDNEDIYTIRVIIDRYRNNEI